MYFKFAGSGKILTYSPTDIGDEYDAEWDYYVKHCPNVTIDGKRYFIADFIFQYKSSGSKITHFCWDGDWCENGVMYEYEDERQGWTITDSKIILEGWESHKLSHKLIWEK